VQSDTETLTPQHPPAVGHGAARAYEAGVVAVGGGRWTAT
jgi:hypothetical protein